MENRYWEDLNVGDAFVSPARTVTESDVVNFACLSGDFNPIHTDEEYARATAFRGRIAHGLLGLALQSGLGQRAIHPPVATMAFLAINHWRFVGPIRLGDTIRVRLEVAGKKETSHPDRGVVTWKRTVLNQRGETVQEGETVTMVYRRPVST